MRIHIWSRKIPRNKCRWHLSCFPAYHMIEFLLLACIWRAGVMVLHLLLWLLLCGIGSNRTCHQHWTMKPYRWPRTCSEQQLLCCVAYHCWWKMLCKKWNTQHQQIRVRWSITGIVNDVLLWPGIKWHSERRMWRDENIVPRYIRWCMPRTLHITKSKH